MTARPRTVRDIFVANLLQRFLFAPALAPRTGCTRYSQRQTGPIQQPWEGAGNSKCSFARTCC